MKDIAVSVTCYNNEKEVLEFAKSLSKQKMIDRIQLLVTCNACENYDCFKSALNQVLPSALSFYPGGNLGYLNGCLYGIENMKCDCSWVMICNTDIEFVGDNYFERVLENVGERVWCIGSDIVLKSTGMHQNPFLRERPSKVKIYTWRIVYSWYPIFCLYFMLHELRPKKEKPKDNISDLVYAVHGSCFVLKKECVDEIIRERPDIFMYGEELLIAEIVRKNKCNCLFTTKACVLHNENQVTSSIGNRKKQSWFKQSFKYLYDNHLKKR